MGRGSFLAIRHFSDGTIARMKSNALGALLIQIDSASSCGIAIFTGKATHTYWTGSEYVTSGGNSYTIYVRDCNEPGTGWDYIAIDGSGLLDMVIPPAKIEARAVQITGGNIVVPHTPKR